MGEKILRGHILDVVNKQITNGELHIKNGKIASIVPITDLENNAPYIMPGFIDSHVHIESSMLLPSHYADVAIRHGVIGCVCDPHEIANVCGMQGIDYMIEDSRKRNFHFAFTAPSCVPATPFETSGFSLNSNEVRKLLSENEVVGLAEMMNFPGVLNSDEEVMAKILAAKEVGKPIDGHAPMLSGKDLIKYAKAGISTDHECSTLQEAEEKINAGMKIIIREGSAAKNFETLYPLIDKFPEDVMLCADDIHPDELLNGYIDILVKRSVKKGLSLWNILQASSLNPVLHYNLPIGLLRINDSADMINLQDMNVILTFINGECVYNSTDNTLDYNDLDNTEKNFPNNFHAIKIKEEDIKCTAQSSAIKVIKAKDKQLFTESIICKANIKNNNIVSDIENDILKIVVYNRYNQSKASVGFIKGFELKKGALASTIAHDSHNIIAIGTSDSMIVKAINELIENKGGICAVDEEKKEILCLPFGGLMTDERVEIVAEKYKSLNNFARELGCRFHVPFMTMAFLALLVIPELKISDKGLFDVKNFCFTSVFA